MAKFIVNSTNTVAVRKDEVVALIISQGKNQYLLDIRTIRETALSPNVGFEQAATLPDVQAKAAAILVALES
jgi:hypothetical protein